MPNRPLFHQSLLGALGLFVLLAAFEVLVLRPGLGAPEELANLALIEQASSGWRWWLRFGGGAWSRGLQSLFLAGPWAWQAIYTFNALAFGLLIWGLWCLGRELGGKAAATAAIAVALSAPFTFLQSRTTFAYVLVPGVSLCLAVLVRRRQGAALSALLGLILGLLCVDYDAWIFAVPAAALAWSAAPRDRRARFLPMFIGLILGLGWVAWMNHPYQAAWTAQRASVPTRFLANLRSFAFGGESPKAMGLEHWPSLPLMAWPGLLWAARVAPGWLWAWAGFGLLGLVPGGPLQEPNRAIVAWPALLLLAGLGWSRILSSLNVSARSRVMAVFLVAAPLLGYAQFHRIIEVWDQRVHGLSRRLFLAADFLRSEGAPGGSGLRLDARDSWVLGRFAGLDPGTGDAQGWVLMPPDLADPEDVRWGAWKVFEAGGKRSYLLRPSPEAWSLIRKAAESPSLQADFSALPDGERLRILRERSRGLRSPLMASIEEAARVQSALRLGSAMPDDLSFSLFGPNLGRFPLEQLQGAFADSPIAEKAGRNLAALERPGERWRRAHAEQP